MPPLDIAEGGSTYVLSASQLLVAGRGIERGYLAELLATIFHSTTAELRTYEVRPGLFCAVATDVCAGKKNVVVGIAQTLYFAAHLSRAFYMGDEG